MIKKAIFIFRNSDLINKSSQSLIMQVVGIGISFLLILCLSRVYSAEALGAYSIAFVVLQICGMITVFGLDSASVKFIASFRQNRQWNEYNFFLVKSLIFIVISSIILSLLVFFSAKYIVKDNPLLLSFIQLTAVVILPYSVYNFVTGCFRGNGNIFAWITFKSCYLQLAYLLLLLIPVVSKNLKTLVPQLFALSVVLTSIASIIVFFYILGKEHLPLNFTNLKSSVPFKEMRSIAFPMFLFSSSLMLSSWLNTLLIGSFGSVKDTGIYRILERISAVTLLSIQAINSVIAPKIAAAYSQNNLHLIQTHVSKSIKLVFWTSFPVQALIIIFAPAILNFFGQNFSYAVNALYIIIAGQIINSLAGPVGQILNMSNYQVFLRNASFFALIISVIAGYLLIPKYGLIGAAVSSFINSLILNLLCVIKVKKSFNFWSVYLPKINFS